MAANGATWRYGHVLVALWRDMLLARATELQKSGKRMILLWMDGGPSQYDTFNPKPGSQYQGPAHAIHTVLPGVQVAEGWPNTARKLDQIALIRSMVSDEKDHERAIALVRTGYHLTPAVRYPTWGSVVSKQLAVKQIRRRNNRGPFSRNRHCDGGSQ